MDFRTHGHLTSGQRQRFKLTSRLDFDDVGQYVFPAVRGRIPFKPLVHIGMVGSSWKPQGWLDFSMKITKIGDAY